jgi:hypothetical protein
MSPVKNASRLKNASLMKNVSPFKKANPLKMRHPWKVPTHENCQPCQKCVTCGALIPYANGASGLLRVMPCVSQMLLGDMPAEPQQSSFSSLNENKIASLSWKFSVFLIYLLEEGCFVYVSYICTFTSYVPLAFKSDSRQGLWPLASDFSVAWQFSQREQLVFRHWSKLHTLGRIFKLETYWQGCQMVCFQIKNPNFGKFWRALE